MTQDAAIWFYLFWTTFVAGIIWAISREIHLRTMAKNQEKTARLQASSSRVLKFVCKKIDSSNLTVQSQFADVKKLILDVEDRETQRRIELGLGQHGRDKQQTINISGGDRTDLHGGIHGGQQNIGKTSIGGEQAQQNG